MAILIRQIMYIKQIYIKLVDKTITKQIVGRNLFNIITIDNELIKLVI